MELIGLVEWSADDRPGYVSTLKALVRQGQYQQLLDEALDEREEREALANDSTTINR